MKTQEYSRYSIVHGSDEASSIEACPTFQAKRVTRETRCRPGRAIAISASKNGWGRDTQICRVSYCLVSTATYVVKDVSSGPNITCTSMA